jgi:hypothetical protein
MTMGTSPQRLKTLISGDGDGQLLALASIKARIMTPRAFLDLLTSEGADAGSGLDETALSIHRARPRCPAVTTEFSMTLTPGQ